MSEPRQARDRVEGYIATVRALLFRPGAFFAALVPATHYAESMGFLFITVAISTLIIALHTLGMALFVAPLVWLLVFVGNWLWAVYLSVMARLLGKRPLSRTHAFQLLSYANMPLLLAWVPLVHAVIGVWTLALLWLGLTRSAGLDGVRALFIVIIPVALFALGSAALVLWLASHATIETGTMHQWL